MKNIEFLAEKRAIVTVAADGIGECICRKLAREYHMDLVITGSRRDELSVLAGEMRGYGVRVVECIGDLSDLSFADAILSAADKELGGVDVIINNAGLSRNCPAEDMTPELFDSIMRVNVSAPYFFSQRAIPMLRRSDCATIINICSVDCPGQSAYAASKHALLGLSKFMANDLCKENIRVHAVSPGAVNANMIALARPELSPEGMSVASDAADIVGFYLENRMSSAGSDESVASLSRENECPFEKHGMASAPLLYRAAQNAIYGRRYEFDSGSITDAMFVYLDGSPSPESINALRKDYCARPIVCLTASWESHIRKNYPNAHVFKRHMMKPARHFMLDSKICIPDGFKAALFDERAFELHPFSHGENYPSFAAFRQHGAGAVVWHNDRVVASASSFLSFNNEVELDVSTEEEYRGKGLATACVSLMLQDCARREITVHWDAQNEISHHLAEKFGLELECCYSVYYLPKQITDETEAPRATREPFA